MNEQEQNALVQELQFLKKLIYTLPGNVFWRDINGHYLGCNNNVAKLLGFKSPQDIVGKTSSEILGVKIAKVLDENDKKVMESNQTYIMEELAVDNDLNSAIYISTKVPLHNEQGEVIGLVGAAYDITAQKKIEQELKKTNAMQEAFIENMQHDLRTPALGVCTALADLLKAETKPEKRENLLLIYKSAKRLHDLCVEITDFDSAGYYERLLINKKFNLNKLFKSVVELNQTAAYKKGLMFDFKIANGTPEILKGDNYRLRRLLINLIGNAIKFTNEGKIDLLIKPIKFVGNQVVLQFEIRDTGIGITQEKKDFIYEKVQQGPLTSQNVYRGSGLGLQLVKKYVAEMKGDIEVQSHVGLGTTFYLTLPFDLPLNQDLLDDKELEDFLPSPWDETEFDVKSTSKDTATQCIKPEIAGQLSVLLIEDDYLSMIAGKNGLESLHCHVTTADSIQLALALLEKIKFDLVVSDIGLPDGNGFDLVKTIKTDTKALNNQTPFFALTAHGGKEKIAEAEAAGFLVLLTKPLVPKTFQALLSTAIRASVPPSLESNPPINDNAIIDWNFAKQYGLSDKAYAELMDSLCRELPGEIQQVKAVAEKKDNKQLYDLIHKLKGGFCYFGVPRLQKVTEHLCQAIKNQDHTPTLDIAADFENFYKEAELLLQEYRQSVSSHVESV